MGPGEGSSGSSLKPGSVYHAPPGRVDGGSRRGYGVHMGGSWNRISAYFGLRDAPDHVAARDGSVRSEQIPSVARRDSQLHRILVYWGLREDAQLEAMWAEERVDSKTQLLGLPLGVGVLIGLFSLGILVIRLFTDGNTDLGSVVWFGARLLWALVFVGVIAALLVRAGRGLTRRARS